MSTRRFTTDKQRDAARRNGSKSRGPVTEPGKRKASANNQRHLLATDSIEHIVHDPAFHEILASYRRDFAPANAIEDDLVIRMAAARWRAIQSSNLERATLDEYARIAAEEAGPDSAYTRIQMVTLGFKRALRNGVPFAAYHRYEAHNTRRWLDAYRSLMEVRKLFAHAKIRFEPGHGPTQVKSAC